MSVSGVITKIEAIVSAATPDYLPGDGFTLASRGAPLDRLPTSGADTTRGFQVVASTPDGLGDFVGSCYEVFVPVTVWVRYAVDLDTEGWHQAMVMVASDQARIVRDVMQPPAGVQWAGELLGIYFDSADPLEASESVKGIHTTRINFRALVAVGA